tara:strand:- start:137 stop:364 length:228 start_codon:yes stop_codon:yes gene_type:complete
MSADIQMWTSVLPLSILNAPLASLGRTAKWPSLSAAATAAASPEYSPVVLTLPPAALALVEEAVEVDALLAASPP